MDCEYRISESVLEVSMSMLSPSIIPSLPSGSQSPHAESYVAKISISVTLLGRRSDRALRKRSAALSAPKNLRPFPVQHQIDKHRLSKWFFSGQMGQIAFDLAIQSVSLLMSSALAR